MQVGIRHWAGHMNLVVVFVLGSLLCVNQVQAQEDDPVFSGPQVGEALTGFEAEFADDQAEEKTFDTVSNADGDPVVLFFVNEFTRPSIGLLRAVSDAVDEFADDGLHCGIVFLTSDVTAMRAQLSRASRALPQQFSVGIYADGLEGPGAYGLNRNVGVTVLVGKENKVTANFAIVQPSIQADGFKIVSAVADAVGAEPPVTEEAWSELHDRMRRNPQNNNRMQARYRQMMQPVIQKDASEEEIDQAAASVEELAAENEQFRTMVGDATRRIVESGRLEQYGNEFSQAYLKKWAEEYK